MKKIIVFLSLLAFIVTYTTPLISQETDPVKISETERIVDKYLAKAGTVIDSTFSKIEPMVQQGFAAYVQGYKMRGTINFFGILIVLILSLIFFGIGTYLEIKSGNNFDEFEASTFIVVCSCVVGFVGFIFLLTCGGDSFVMMTAPEYYVIKDLLQTVGGG